jgi:putative ABC transport system substrate-binding protein
MRRRQLITLLGGAIAAGPLAALAQGSAKVYRIGLLSPGPATTDNTPRVAPLLRGLAKLGYIQGKNVMLERRGADGQMDRLPALVAELTASPVDVIVTFGYPPARAAKEETTLPVVAINAGDPVGTGLVNSLAHPEGHLTGISDVSVEVTPKRLELLKEVSPSLHRVAVLWNADDLGMTLRYRALEAGAKALGVEVQPLGVREPDDFANAFSAMDSKAPDAIMMVADALTVLNRKRVFEFAAAHRLPAIYEFDYLVRDGGLMSYGPDADESYARVAVLVDRILKGAKPADLPFEQPTLFRLAVNLKTAKSINLSFPESLLVGADDVIE